MIQEKDADTFARYLDKLQILPPDGRQMLEAAPPSGNFEVRGDGRLNVGDEKVSIRYSIKKEAEPSLFSISGYTMTILHVPPIEHGTFQGIDTNKLERKLEGLKWNEDFMDSPAISIGKLITGTELLLLSGMPDARANEIASLLMLKYWACTPMEPHLQLTVDRSRYEREMTFPLNGDGFDVTPIQGYHLMCGRAVQMDAAVSGNKDAPWLVCKDDALEKVTGFSLDTLVHKLPFVQPEDAATAAELIPLFSAGNQIEVHLIHDGKPVNAWAQADPLGRAIAVLDKDMKPLEISGLSLDQQQMKDSNTKKPKQSKKGPRL